MRIVVLGYIVRGPIGGLAWHHLQYVLGLVRLGHDVCFIEDSDDYPVCYDPERHVVDTDPTYGIHFATEAFALVGLEKQWAYHDAHHHRWLGPAANRSEDFCRSADVLLNVSAVNPLRDWTLEIPSRVLIDTDPVFTQVRNITDEDARKRALDHTAFFTFAENVERGTAVLPDDKLPWRATRQPVVLDAWPVVKSSLEAPYTTVMQWQSYPSVVHNDASYGTKSESFQPYIDLPARVTVPLEIALGGSDAPRELLRQHGWRLQNPLEVARTPERFQKYVRESRGELSVAKQGYVASNSGWFSERSASYLASGRPVVTQDTGFTEWLPVGKGLFSFRNEIDAIDALKRVERDYTENATTARKLAEEYFDSRDVLTRLLDEATATEQPALPSS